MACSSPVHDDVEVDLLYDGLIHLPRSYPGLVGKFPCQPGGVFFTRTGLPASARVPAAVRSISV